MIVNESELVVTPQEINDDTKNLLETFQDLVSLLMEYFHDKGGGRDERGGLKDIQSFKNFKKDLKRFHNQPFVAPILKQVEEYNKEILDIYRSKRKIRKPDSYSPKIDKVINAWKNHDIDTVLQMNNNFLRDYVENYKKAYHDNINDLLRNFKNPFYIENPIIFQSTNFMEILEKSELKEIINKNLNEYRYSYLRLPDTKKDDYQYLAYYILELKKDQEPVKLSDKKLKKFFDMAYDNEEYKTLTMKVKEVLFENKKEYIPEILEKIKDFPEIQKANERSKKQYNKVYRGIPADDETEKDVIKYDKKQDYVSTSMDKNAAIKFAYKIGHLESEENRRSENGYIITYNVDEDSIVLDTTIFGGVFMENEIIIDPKKAKVDNIESV